MAWLEDQRTTTTDTQDNIWLKFDQLKSVGDKSEIRMRILETEPVGVWQHWFQNKPYNCCRPDNDCPVCVARAKAKQDSPDTYRDDFNMRFRYFFNVLVNENDKPVVRVFGLGSGLGKDLRSYSERYGPLTNYDITVRKTQTGKFPQNVEYSLFYDGARPFTTEEMEAAYHKHDLSQFIQPAPVADLAVIAKGEMPQQSENARLLAEIKKELPDDVDPTHLEIDSNTPSDKLESLLRSLRGQ